MDNNHFHPIAGQIYQNHNGIKYLCLESEGFSNDGLFISVSSGYVLLAHGCKQNDDGSIEWNCSEDKGFHDVHKFSELYGFDSTGKSIVSQDDDEPSTWAEVIKIEFEGVRAELESLVYYDTKQRCFNENINPTTYDQMRLSNTPRTKGSLNGMKKQSICFGQSTSTKSSHWQRSGKRV